MIINIKSCLSMGKSKWVKIIGRCGIILCLPLVSSANDLTLTDQIKQLVELYQPMDEQDRAKPLIDLELIIIATLLDQNQQPYHANQYKQYLLEFYPDSSLAKTVTSIPSDTPYLTAYDPEPLFSRLVKDTFYYVQDGLTENPDQLFNEFVEIIELMLKKDQLTKIRQLTKFVKQSTNSVFSGWAVYYLTWTYYLSSSNQQERFYDLWQQHPNHPVGKESQAVLDLEYFNPDQISLLSVSLPGWGEEFLEPGLGVAGGQLYYELLYLAGAVGFAVAAQQNNRANNLTGALIFANLLFLNHHGSADRAYVMAHRRNYANQKKFNNQQAHRSLLAKGQFEAPQANLTHGPLVQHYLKLGLTYQLAGMVDSLSERKWIKSDSMHNVGLVVGYHGDGAIIDSDYYQLSLGLAPQVNFMINPLLDNPDNPILTKAGQQLETTGSLNLVLSNRLKFGSGSYLSLTMMVGQGYRWRALTLEQQTTVNRSWITSGAMSLAWHGMSGHFWEAGINVDDSFKQEELILFNEIVNLPSVSWRLQFNLGVKF